MPEPEPNLFEEANRQLVICNACRYCEGLCPVFRAIETRRDFAKGDVFYLANLCHDCRACYYACMFTPPHEFAINIPQILSEARMESYKQWSWPGLLARAFKEPRIALLLADLVVSLAVIAGALWIGPSRLFAAHTGPGAFYAIVPYLAMVIPAVALFFFGIAIWLRGGDSFLVGTPTAPSRSRAVSGKALLRSARRGPCSAPPAKAAARAAPIPKSGPRLRAASTTRLFSGAFSPISFPRRSLSSTRIFFTGFRRIL